MNEKVAPAAGKMPSQVYWDGMCCYGRRPSRLGAIFLIGLGAFFLLHTLDIFHWSFIWRYWPMLLIALGGWLLWKRTAGGPPAT